MKRYFWFAVALVTAVALGEEPRGEADVTKRRVIERPTEAVVAALAPPTAPGRDPEAGDRTKVVLIEPAAEAIVRGSQPLDRAALQEPTVVPEADNPAVKPGKVNWHEDVAAAIAAAKISRKPVLVFHLLGELDQRFT